MLHLGFYHISGLPFLQKLTDSMHACIRLPGMAAACTAVLLRMAIPACGGPVRHIM